MKRVIPGLNLRCTHRSELGLISGPSHANEMVLGKRRISADTALRLGRYFEMSPQFWLALQMDYDLDVEEDKLGARLEREVRPYAMTN